MSDLTPEERKYQWNYGKVGQFLFEASDQFKALLDKTLKFTDGHKPKIEFSNLTRVRHVDTVVYVSKSKAIRTIIEVKTTTNARRHDFTCHGVCGEVLASARDAGIPTYLAVVRLKTKPPDSIITPKGCIEYTNLLRENGEYSIELYTQDDFELPGKRFVVTQLKRSART